MTRQTPTVRDLFTRRKADSRLARLSRFPLTRLVLALLFISPVVLLSNLLAIHVIEVVQEPLGTALDWVRAILTLTGIWWAYRAYCRVVEKRDSLELSLPRAGRELGIGFAVGAGLVAGLVALLAVLGMYRVTAFEPAPILLQSLLLFGMGALVQEFGFRVLLFKLTEEIFGTVAAVGAVALLFGLAHLGNDNASLTSCVAIALSDALLSGAFVLTRRLWLVWGIHTGWNLFQAGVFGMPNSGITFPSWIQAELSGPGWLTGGSFGLEASIVAIGCNLALGLWLLHLARRRGQFVRATWLRGA